MEMVLSTLLRAVLPVTLLSAWSWIIQVAVEAVLLDQLLYLVYGLLECFLGLRAYDYDLLDG